MIPPTDWKPSPADIAWQNQMINLLVKSKRTVWGVPCSESAFEIDRLNKTFRLLTGEPADETNRRIAVVFIHMGYREVEGNPAEGGNPVNRVKDFFGENQ